jgi:hypothetical protein
MLGPSIGIRLDLDQEKRSDSEAVAAIGMIHAAWPDAASSGPAGPATWNASIAIRH